MDKRIELNCTPEIKDIFMTALRNYIAVVFPPGSADCGLVAREALLDSLAALEREFAANGVRAGYNKRLRAMVKEAIRLHYRLQAAETGGDHARECDLLLEVAEGVARTDADLTAARSIDRAGKLSGTLPRL